MQTDVVPQALDSPAGRNWVAIDHCVSLSTASLRNPPAGKKPSIAERTFPLR